MIVAVDLAARYSAACLLSTGNDVLSQWDSWQVTEKDFVASLVRPFRHEDPPLVMAVEDLPQTSPWTGVVKKVCRIQGRIIESMDRLGLVHLLLFVPPSVWRRHYGAGLKRGTGPAAVVPVAAAHHYQPPELTGRCTQRGDKATARKVATDYCAAYLIGAWAVDFWSACGHFDAPGTSRYVSPNPTPTILA